MELQKILAACDHTLLRQDERQLRIGTVEHKRLGAVPSNARANAIPAPRDRPAKFAILESGIVHQRAATRPEREDLGIARTRPERSPLRSDWHARTILAHIFHALCELRLERQFVVRAAVHHDQIIHAIVLKP